MKKVRLGILGAARIAPYTIYKHASSIPNLELAGLAEEYNSAEFLAKYAKKHGITKTYRSFDGLLARDDIDAVYLPLPINMHKQWTLKAIAAGKHVLCEKPFTANADEAEEIRIAAQGKGLVVGEAMHFRQHPLSQRVRNIIDSGEIGDIKHIKASLSAIMGKNDFRFKYSMAGGSTIDLGCYALGFIRATMNEEPSVISAKAIAFNEPEIDGSMQAQLAFSNGATADVFTALRNFYKPLTVSMRFFGTQGSIRILNFVKPEVFHIMLVRGINGTRIERVPGESTYRTQLVAFLESVQTGKPFLTDIDDAVNNMRLIDAVYEAASMKKRGLKL